MVWTKRSYQYDAQGSTRALHDNTGTLTDTFSYDAWGNEVARTGTTETPFCWNGRVGYYCDEDTGTHQVRRRPYRPLVGIWLAIDPIWSRTKDMRFYMYVYNNPCNLFDPSGLEPPESTLPGVAKFREALIGPQPPQMISEFEIAEADPARNLFNVSIKDWMFPPPYEKVNVAIVPVLFPSLDPNKPETTEPALVTDAHAAASQGNVNYIYSVRSIADANKRLSTFGIKHNECINELYIVGHGGPLAQVVGSIHDPKKVNPRLEETNIGAMFSNVRFCKPCEIILSGCLVAGDGFGWNDPTPQYIERSLAAGKKFLTAIRDLTGCSVKGCSTLTLPGNGLGYCNPTMVIYVAAP